MNTKAVYWPNGNPESEYRSSFTNRLHKLLSLLPSNSRVQDVVGPIQETGEKKLREIGLKARAFNALFHAWEALHLVQDNDKMLLRADVLQALKSHPEIAADLQMDHTELVHAFEEVHSFLVRLGNRLFAWTAPYFADHMTLHAQFWNASRGIVFTAGDSQAPYLLTSIESIRQLGCDLPIEVMYLGDDDLSAASRVELEDMPGVVTRDMSPMVNDDGWKLRGWAAKPFAILLSTFREVIFIDADSLFLQNPADLFLHQGYQDTGALFFKDRLFMPGSKKEWLKAILPPNISKKVKSSRLWTGESTHMQESGVVVVDKWRHFIALLLVTRMNGPDRDGSKEDGRVGVYDMVFGDKETFWLGWELVGDTDYVFHGGDAAVMGKVEVSPKLEISTDNSTANDRLEDTNSHFTICAPQILHLGEDGRPMWFNGWILPNKFSQDDHQEPANFEAFISEPRDPQNAGSWKLQKDNNMKH
ncbi:hypothetical protein CNMCM5793_009111 [Aspergillus hiratsukae]|uniref:Alpha-1,3-mannosyltransferase n=1 Tax=Aspergillus hiratsukae TaxID=1194566 RepID=A0A8H6PZW1_9EURO|nr:hypothetical protein CNMCM5793_009111 [Aspergillus hiratsukae]KAF7163234.1 hypothetical protein CNMCM6106_000222 [Aspergillus hiratsukae]